MSASRSVAREREGQGEALAGEFRFDTADFDRVRRLIRAHAGIDLHEGKRAMVYSRLARRLRELGDRAFSDYLRRLDDADSEEWQPFVNSLTTNLTSFFREQHHFPLLAAALRQRQGKPVRLWCNAASTGEEPYSLAMTVVEALGPAAPVRIVCSDIDTNVLAIAQRGVYPEGCRGLGPEQLRRHFLRGKGRNAGFIRAGDELRRLLEFRPFNLMETNWQLGAPFDIVFCRNVMIYFDWPTQRGVLERMHKAMAPGSLLFAGHSESFAEARDLFRPRGSTVYERL